MEKHTHTHLQQEEVRQKIKEYMIGTKTDREIPTNTYSERCRRRIALL